MSQSISVHGSAHTQHVQGQGHIEIPLPPKPHLPKPGTFLHKRGKRITDIFDKVKRGDVLGAGMDYLQMRSLGSKVGDAAQALGLVDEAGKNFLSAVCNMAIGSPAAVGDIADGFRALSENGQAQDVASGSCAPAHYAPRPAEVYAKNKGKVKGYASLTVQQGDLKLTLDIKNDQLRLALQNRIAQGGIVGRFVMDMPGLQLAYGQPCATPAADPTAEPTTDPTTDPTADTTADTTAAAAAEPTTSAAEGESTVSDSSATSEAGPKVKNDEFQDILNDPTLSFEEILAKFLMLVCKKQEDKMVAMMKKYNEFKKREQDKTNIKKNVEKSSKLAIAAGLSVAGIPIPLAMSAANVVAPMLGEAATEAKDRADDVADQSKSGDDPTKLSGEEKRFSEQAWMLEIQQQQNTLKRMNELLSTILKNSHDMQMVCVRAMK